MLIDIIYQDEDILVINKPPGLPSQPTPDPKRASVLSLLQNQLPNTKIFLHHRLDRDTSGVLLFGINPRANKPLTNIFRDHQIEKTYLALAKINPSIPCPEQWTVVNHMAPVKDHRQKIMRMVLVNKGGWRAETHFKLLRTVKDFCYVEAKPVTGRTHQIRVHLACDKRPILGDNLYGGKSTLVPRMMLHAHQLQLKHPISGALMEFTAPLPTDFQKILG